MDVLTSALAELEATGNCSKVRGVAKDIVASKRRSGGAAVAYAYSGNSTGNQ